MDEVILAEDETNLRTSLQYTLEKEGWTVRAFSDGGALWDWWKVQPPSQARRVVILDITMPRMDGLEVCRRIRSQNEETPLMFLSSRDEEFDRVLGLELGADDYLCKPFSLRELTARVRVLFRRWRPGVTTRGEAPDDQEKNLLVQGPLVLHSAGCTVSWMGQPVPLTITEFRILHHLVVHRGVVKTRDQLQNAAYPEDIYLSDRAMDSHIKRIRKKMGGSVPLETVYGLGYKWLG